MIKSIFAPNLPARVKKASNSNELSANMHVFWFYTFVLGPADSSPLLEQAHLKTEEVKRILKTTEVQLPFVGDEHFITEDLQSSSADQRKYLPASKARNSNPTHLFLSI